MFGLSSVRFERSTEEEKSRSRHNLAARPSYKPRYLPKQTGLKAVPFAALVAVVTKEPIREQGSGGLYGLDLACIDRSGYFILVYESLTILCTSPQLIT